MNRLRELRALTAIRIKLFFREPEALFWVILFPLIMAFVLGFAFRNQSVGPSKISVAASAADVDPALVSALENGDFEVEWNPAGGIEEAARRVSRGALDAAVDSGSPPGLVYDPGREPSVLARHRIRDGLAGPGLAVRIADNPTKGAGNRYIDWLFPALLGMNLMGTGLWGIGFAIAEQRQKKLLRRFLVTPMRKSSYLLSFVASRLAFLAFEGAVLLTFGLFVLGVPMLGAAGALLLLAVAGALSFAGLGLLVASRPRTIEGISGLLNLVMMPMWLCSGVFFSYERFPEPVQAFCKALPLTALNDALRAVMLDGASLASQHSQLGVLALWGGLSFVSALRVFRWE